MRKPRKPSPKAPVLPSDLRERAEKNLQDSYDGFISGTSEEEPRHFVTRSAAAREALEHLAQLRELAGDPEAEPSGNAVLAEARAEIADENDA